MKPITTFIIPSIRRDTLQRAIDSIGKHPYLVGYDDYNRGQSVIKNELIRQAETEWVSFLDDDDTITADYVQRLGEEISSNPSASAIHFKEYFLRGAILPSWPKVEWGNVGVSFSIKRAVALQHPFVSERFEDLKMLQAVEAAGLEVVFSPYLVYRARH